MFRILVLASLWITCGRDALAQERLTVQAPDGVAIGVLKSGSGPALLLIHGAGVDSSIAWRSVIGLLNRHFTVYAMDRRGRGMSGDTRTYSISKEADDIAAVARRVGQRLTVLGHSYGGLCALVALDRLERDSNLILYEPPHRTTEPGPESVKVLDELDRALEVNDREKVLTVFLRDWVQVPPAVVATFRSSPDWSKQLDAAPTLPREARASAAVRFTATHLRSFKQPTTMLIGSLTQGHLREAADYICESMASCSKLILERQRHIAMATAPELFVSSILKATGNNVENVP